MKEQYDYLREIENLAEVATEMEMSDMMVIEQMKAFSAAQTAVALTRIADAVSASDPSQYNVLELLQGIDESLDAINEELSI